MSTLKLQYDVDARDFFSIIALEIKGMNKNSTVMITVNVVN